MSENADKVAQFFEEMDERISNGLESTEFIIAVSSCIGCFLANNYPGADRDRLISGISSVIEQSAKQVATMHDKEAEPIARFTVVRQ
ncbi:hypothetical protein GXP70_12300 [Paenibacillus lycopersici]|uniref:Uncharacterized protein n=1 Tax=Paenibacillus lycopersici TaxID=2704462 RepID=A0A6C0FYR8_9BACL|nr:hypothetical protein [Paenibacillus lycopersici]QHT60643.1 hypothetical protein GXP70_12300 [Paenibacillus lycopersici]